MYDNVKDESQLIIAINTWGWSPHFPLYYNKRHIIIWLCSV